MSLCSAAAVNQSPNFSVFLSYLNPGVVFYDLSFTLHVMGGQILTSVLYVRLTSCA